MSPAHLEQAAATRAPATIGAILFTDLVGFTEYTGAVGDAAALSVLDSQTAIVDAVLIGCRDARVVKEIGDGLMIWFGSAADALARACALLIDVETVRLAGEFPLAMRLGLHHGTVLERGDDLIGQTVNIAARVCALAGPGELLVSERLMDEVYPDPICETAQPIGPARVKGVDEPVWLHRVSG